MPTRRSASCSVCPHGLEGRLREVVEGLEIGAYRFTKYMTGDRKPKAELTQVTICLLGDAPDGREGSASTSVRSSPPA